MATVPQDERRRVLRWLAWIVGVAIGVPLAGYLAFAIGLSVAYSPTYAWRILVYGDSDIGDWRRLPSRPVLNAPPLFQFAGPPDPDLPARLRGVTYHHQGRVERIDDLEAFLRGSETTALLVIQDDRLLYEGYFKRLHAGLHRDLWPSPSRRC